MIYPLFAMVALAIGYGFYTGYTRFTLVKRGEVSGRYFKTMSGDDIPEKIIVTTRHFGNLMETPPLFYMVCTLIILTGIESTFTITAGWLYVFFRASQMYVHNTYNYPLHRMIWFALSIFVISALWIYTLIKLG